MTNVDQQIIARIPHKGMDGREWGAVIQNELVRIWMEGMSPAELVAWEATSPYMDRAPANLLAKLDEIILEQTEDLGWRMELSEIVQFRQSEWAPETHRKFGAACSRAREIELGERRPRIKDPIVRAGWRDTIAELQLVCNRMRSGFLTLRRLPNDEELRNRFRTLVQESPEYRQLPAYLDGWLEFVKENPEAFRLAVSRAAPVELFLAFQAWASGFTEDTLRQKLYRPAIAKASSR